MRGSWSRRRLLLAGGSAVFAGAAGGGVVLGRRGGAAPPAGALRIDESDPTATPLFAVLDAPPPDAPSPEPTATPTPSPTSTPTPAPSPPMPTPTQIARPQWGADLLRQVVRSGPASRPLVALTIDDGWFSRDRVLEVLEAKKVQLSLFLTGRAIPGDHAFIARALNAGHEIANHTMDHYDLTNRTNAYIRKDIQDFEDLVKSVVSGATTQPYMRPSGGALNQTVIDASVALGYRPILWSASVGDGSASTTPSQMVGYGLAGARPGAIILMHFSDRAVTALPALIDGIRARGLEPVTLTRLLGDS